MYEYEASIREDVFCGYSFVTMQVDEFIHLLEVEFRKPHAFLKNKLM